MTVRPRTKTWLKETNTHTQISFSLFWFYHCLFQVCILLKGSNPNVGTLKIYYLLKSKHRSKCVNVPAGTEKVALRNRCQQSKNPYFMTPL